MSSYLVEETDGISRFTLEDGSGFILLEQTAVTVTPTGGFVVSVRRPTRRLVISDDDALVALTLLARTVRRRRTS